MLEPSLLAVYVFIQARGNRAKNFFQKLEALKNLVLMASFGFLDSIRVN